MKIITWNCNMAFRKKAPAILAHKPDILVVPECEHPDHLLFDEKTPRPKDLLWFGSNRHKGLAIFSYSNFKFKALDVYNESLRLVVPIEVTGKQFSFLLFAIWANNPQDPEGQYVEQVWKAIHYYDHLLPTQPTILIGDFNSNTIWDRKYRAGNHSNVVKRLEEKGIFSLYHWHHKQTHGKELHPTLYLYRHQDKPYHIDYCFASSDFIQHLKRVEVGDYNSWIQYSDHVPVIATFKKTLLKKKLE